MAKQESEQIETLKKRLDVLTVKYEVLTVKYEALRKSHHRLALKTLGDTPETNEFLAEMQAEILENYPESAK